jgi:long-chain acyl-CoA synthetase
VLVRDPARWQATARRLGLAPDAVMALRGDVTREDLGLTSTVRNWLTRHATAIVHLAADTCFSRPLDEARQVNLEGTRHVLDLAGSCPHLSRVAYVSTAFVAGRRMGRIPECAAGAADATIGWVNAYEQSKAAAETLVRATAGAGVILRSSTVICDGVAGVVTQRNAAHRALRLFRDGLAPMIPGLGQSTLDVVPADYVADGIAGIALRDGVDGATVHLCAGAGAMPLDELLDESYASWAEDADWRRRDIARPIVGDLETWQLFARSVEETGNARLRQVTRALSHFLPQLALPKQFDTDRADALLGRAAPVVREYWSNVIRYLHLTDWHGVAGLAEAAA